MKLGGNVSHLMHGMAVAAAHAELQRGVDSVRRRLICPAPPEQPIGGSGDCAKVGLFALVGAMANPAGVLSQLVQQSVKEPFEIQPSIQSVD
jgi:hypothetical protein